MHDDIFHLCIIHRALGVGAPDFFGFFVIGVDADKIHLVQIFEIQTARILYPPSHDQMNFAVSAHGFSCSLDYLADLSVLIASLAASAALLIVSITFPSRSLS